MSDRIYHMDGITSGDLCVALKTTQLASLNVGNYCIYLYSEHFPNYDIKKIWHHTVLCNGKLEIIKLELSKLNDWIRKID